MVLESVHYVTECRVLNKSISTNLVDVYVYKFMLGVRCVGLWAVGCLCVNKLLLFTDERY